MLKELGEYRRELKEDIAGLTWMSAETKAQALEVFEDMLAVREFEILRALQGGLRGPQGDETREPLAALKAITRLQNPSLVVLKDFHPFLKCQNMSVIRRLREWSSVPVIFAFAVFGFGVPLRGSFLLVSFVLGIQVGTETAMRLGRHVARRHPFRPP